MRTLSAITVAVCCALVLPCAAQKARLDGIAAVKDENGRTVYVNAPRPEAASTASARPKRASVLVYWSNQERQWKPVPPPSPSAMRAAREAADEVASYVRSQPAITKTKQATASQNPNYRQIASGRLISNSAVDDAIDRAAARHGVDPNLVRAVIKVESNFNPHAVSKKGAMGLMQLMPATARQLNMGNPFNPEENVDAGVRHLKQLLTSYKGDVSLSLAAYNAGQGAVARFNGVPRFAETQNYVRQITGLYSGNMPMSTRAGSAPGNAPIKMSRSAQGVLTLSNE
jgi:soluble lytic murein transglycosylase-like protein